VQPRADSRSLRSSSRAKPAFQRPRQQGEQHFRAACEPGLAWMPEATRRHPDHRRWTAARARAKSKLSEWLQHEATPPRPERSAGPTLPPRGPARWGGISRPRDTVRRPSSRSTRECPTDREIRSGGAAAAPCIPAGRRCPWAWCDCCIGLGGFEPCHRVRPPGPGAGTGCYCVLRLICAGAGAGRALPEPHLRRPLQRDLQPAWPPRPQAGARAAPVCGGFLPWAPVLLHACSGDPPRPSSGLRGGGDQQRARLGGPAPHRSPARNRLYATLAGAGPLRRRPWRIPMIQPPRAAGFARRGSIQLRRPSRSRGPAGLRLSRAYYATPVRCPQLSGIFGQRGPASTEAQGTGTGSLPPTRLVSTLHESLGAAARRWRWPAARLRLQVVLTGRRRPPNASMLQAQWSRQLTRGRVEAPGLAEQRLKQQQNGVRLTDPSLDPLVRPPRAPARSAPIRSASTPPYQIPSGQHQQDRPRAPMRRQFALLRSTNPAGRLGPPGPAPHQLLQPAQLAAEHADHSRADSMAWRRSNRIGQRFSSFNGMIQSQWFELVDQAKQQFGPGWAEGLQGTALARPGIDASTS